MEPSAFIDKSREPEEKQVKETLGGACKLWAEIRAALATQFAPLAEAWKYSGKKYGWTLQLKRKDRAVVYLTPCKGYFRASFAFGDKAVAAAHKGGLPDNVIAEMDSAKKYPEGRPVRIEVRSKGDADVVKKLAAIKMAN